MVNMKKVFVQSLTVALLSLSSQVIANTLKTIDYQSLPDNGVQLTFEHTEQVSQPSSFVTTSPDSIVIDLPDTQNATTEPKTDVGLGFVDSVTAVQGKSRTRAIIKLLAERPYLVTTNKNNVVVTISGEASQAAPVDSSAVAEPTSITNIDFRRTDTGAGRLEISLSSDE
jgi:type IV pilus assembly protein PilQ